MESLFLLLAVVCGVAGMLGAVLPVLPGPPLSYVGLLLVWFCDGTGISNTSLWVMGILMAVITVLDYVAPVWLTNLSGGSKQATRGATVGMILGLFFMPLGLVLGPFLGALLGELLAHATMDKAFRVAMMSFLAFVVTTGVKIVYGAVALTMLLVEIVKMIELPSWGWF